MEARAAVEFSASDLDAFFELLTVNLAATRRGMEPSGSGEFRGAIEARVGAIAAENEAPAADEVSHRNLLFTSLLLACYRELRDRMGDGGKAVGLLRDSLAEFFRPRIRAYLHQRFEVDPAHPGQAFQKVAANFIANGQSGFGAGFTYEQEVQSGRESFINITHCFFLNFFRANGAPELTPVLCAMDAVWADELNSGPYNVSFERPTLMSSGDDKCRFQFTRVE